MKKLSIFLTIFLLSSFNFAQEESETKPNEIPTVKTTYPVVFPPVLLSEKPNSWAINIYKEGGIIGGSYLNIALNSEGQYQCGEKGSLKSISIKDEFFLELSKSVENIESSFYSKDLDNKVPYCNDCLYSTLSFYLRFDKEKPKDKKPQPFTLDVKKIYLKVLKVVNCD